MNRSKLIVIAVIAVAISGFFFFDLGQYVTLDYLKSQQAVLSQYVQEQPMLSGFLYFTAYVIMAALSLPGAAILTLAGGLVFGLFWGLLLVSFASTIGATGAMLVSRFILRDSIQNKFADQLKSINAGIEKEGAFYLLAMRLVPAIPFFVVNLAMGVTNIGVVTYYLVSQVGMLAGTMVYVFAGTQIASLESPKDILSPGLLVAFTLLGVFPLIAKRFVEYMRATAVLKPYPKPKQFDQNIVVLGAGAAGLVTSYIAAAVKAEVTLIEKHKMGGDCLNTGCVPSKALIRSAKFMADVNRAEDLGFKSATVDYDFADVMARVQRVVKLVEPHDSVERYTQLGVNCIQGEAKITSPYTVQVNGKTITTRNIVIATGARPFVPPIEGIDETDYLTSDTVWDLRELPKRLVVLGGGPIGCELTQGFARLGAEVTQVEMLPRLMQREDPEVSEAVRQRFLHEGVNVLTGHTAKKFTTENGEKVLICEHDGETVRIAYDKVLVAVGRIANVQGFGLEELGVPVAATRTVAVNEYLQTNFPNIYACGDVAGPFQFTHTASHQAWYAAVNALFGSFKKFKADYSVIPWATFTEPEVARVGLNEQDAKAQGINYELSTFDIAELDRAIADEEAHGFIKVLTVPGKDRILGVTIVGEQAGDLIAEYVMAMKHRLGLKKIMGTIHIYPTLAETNKYVAGEWQKAHRPERLLAWVEKFHRWQRGGSGGSDGPGVDKPHTKQPIS